MKLSTRVRYGCRAMLDLALHDEDESVALQLLAREQHIPERYLAKIIQDLRRGGLIRSVRGAGGGYLLNRDAARISMLDVWEALEGPVCPVDCLESPDVCDMVQQCVTRDVWRQIQQDLNRLLSSVSIADLVQRHRRKVRRAAKAAEGGQT